MPDLIGEDYDQRILCIISSVKVDSELVETKLGLHDLQFTLVAVLLSLPLQVNKVQYSNHVPSDP
jgi:hypothetical protein